MLAARTPDEYTHTVANTKKKREWLRDQTALLVDLYRSHSLLYESKNDDYNNKIKKADARRVLRVAMDIQRAEVER